MPNESTLRGPLVGSHLLPGFLATSIFRALGFSAVRIQVLTRLMNGSRY